MEINDTNLKLLILDIIEELKRLRGLWKDEFRDVPPVLWFGDIHNNPQVLVVSANPSRPDQPNSNPRIPYCKKWNIDQPDVEELMKDYNNYFVNNPSKKWFGGDMSHTQGRIEDFLNGLGASFYDGKNYIQAIHIDLLPFSTESTFTAIDSQIMAIEGVPQWINQHLHKMIELIKPNLIIINGSSNFAYFNQCIDMNAQPYTASFNPVELAHKEKSITIWYANKTDNVPPIIATSVNMGSFCFHSKDTLRKLGEAVKKRLNL
jgi:hypothetical protein